MNKVELVKAVAENNGLTQKAVSEIVDSMLNTIVDTVASGEDVSLFAFGTFTTKHRDARTGRNPATGEAMEYAESTRPVFKPAKAFREKVDK